MLWSGQSVKLHDLLNWGQKKKEDAEYSGKKMEKKNTKTKISQRSHSLQYQWPVQITTRSESLQT